MSQTWDTPELAGPFDAVLELVVKRIDVAAGNRTALAINLLVVEMLAMVLEVSDRGLEVCANALAQTRGGLEQGLQSAQDLLFFAVSELVEQRLDPLPGLRGAFAMKLMGDGPQVLTGVVKVQ